MIFLLAGAIFLALRPVKRKETEERRGKIEKYEIHGTRKCFLLIGIILLSVGFVLQVIALLLRWVF